MKNLHGKPTMMNLDFLNNRYAFWVVFKQIKRNIRFKHGSYRSTKSWTRLSPIISLAPVSRWYLFSFHAVHRRLVGTYNYLIFKKRKKVDSWFSAKNHINIWPLYGRINNVVEIINVMFSQVVKDIQNKYIFLFIYIYMSLDLILIPTLWQPLKISNLVRLSLIIVKKQINVLNFWDFSIFLVKQHNKVNLFEDVVGFWNDL
jgi:hypothetical protein